MPVTLEHERRSAGLLAIGGGRSKPGQVSSEKAGVGFDGAIRGQPGTQKCRKVGLPAPPNSRPPRKYEVFQLSNRKEIVEIAVKEKP